MTHRIEGVLAGVVAVALVWLSQPLQGTPPPKGIALTPLGVYRTGLYDEGAVEIAAYDAGSRRVFMTLASRPEVRIVDLSDPAAPVEVSPAIDLTPWGAAAHATSVAVSDGVVAVAVPQGEDDTAAGKVLFFDAATAGLLSQVTVGALPDMVTFTPNGAYVLTADEGQPNQAYTYDPEGSVSLVDLRGGVGQLTDSDVTTIRFTGIDRASLDPSVRLIRAGATVAQDLEPEYVAVSHDSRTAWVTLQENNAVAIVDIPTRAVTAVRGLGFKDHRLPGNGLDGTRDNAVGIGSWPVLGMYQPDGIAAFRSGGETYLVTANEGDVREYDGLNAPNTPEPEAESVGISDITLDPLAFPDAATLQNRNTGLGRLKVTAFDGDDDGDGDYDRLFTFGGRSFSILRADGAMVFDSGDALERITAAAYPANFNASNTNNTRDDRSDDKGPEPEGVTVASLFGRPYMFLMLERIGGVVVFEVTDPANPRFVQYVSTRDFTKATRTPEAGDLGPEAALVIPADDSPSGKPMLLVSNEVSGSLRVFAIAPAN